MKTNQFIALGLVVAAVAIVWTQVKVKKEQKQVEGLKDQQLAETVKPTLATPGIVAEQPQQTFVSQPAMLNYVENMASDALNYIM